ncbi:hypothetical protein ABPG72_020405 [Tetrahymena utriculariae]
MEQKDNPHYKILVLGKTGAGKTTAINMIVNLALDKNYEDKRDIAISQTVTFKGTHQKEQKVVLDCNIQEFLDRQSEILESSQSKSQTKDCFMYTIKSDSYTITLVDSPGLGDTEGTEADEQHIKTIISRVQSLVEINCILYVHRATDCRKDLYLQYYLAQFRGMLTKDYQNNFIVCFTGVVNPAKIDAETVLQEIGIPCEKQIYFENDCLTHIDHLKGKIDDKKLKSYKRSAENFWEQNKEQFHELLSIIKSLQPKKTRDLLDLLVKKESIIKIVFEKIRQIQTQQQEQENLEQIKISYQKVLFDFNNVGPQERIEIKQKQVPYQVTRQRTVIVKDKVTFCYQCQQKCHNPCSLSEIYSKGSYQFYKCTAFFLFVCVKCYHTVSHHGHTNEIPEDYVETLYRTEDYTVTVKDINNITKKELLESKKRYYSQKIQEMQFEINNKELEIERDLKLIALLYEEVKKISLDPTHDTTIEYLDCQINQTKKSNTLGVEERDSLIKKYKNSKQLYITVKQQIQKALEFNQGKTFIQDQDFINLMNIKLKQTEQEIMKSIKESISQAQQTQQNSKALSVPKQEFFSSFKKIFFS